MAASVLFPPGADTAAFTVERLFAVFYMAVAPVNGGPRPFCIHLSGGEAEKTPATRTLRIMPACSGILTPADVAPCQPRGAHRSCSRRKTHTIRKEPMKTTKFRVFNAVLALLCRRSAWWRSSSPRMPFRPILSSARCMALAAIPAAVLRQRLTSNCSIAVRQLSR